MDELTKTLSTCNDSAPGEDMVTYSMIKNMHPTCLNELLCTINMFWSEGTFPDEWKRATVLSFAKPGKDPTVCSNYRPIALTSSVCKLVEKIVNVRLTRTLENNEVISDKQFGFRKHRSTVDALIRLQTDILDTLNRGEHMVVVSFDIQKAYDTSWRFHILKTIHEAGIRGQLAWFIRNFLSERVFRTQVGSNYQMSSRKSKECLRAVS